MEKFKKEFDINLSKNNLCSSFDINISKKSLSQSHSKNDKSHAIQSNVMRNKKKMLSIVNTKNHLINFIPLPKGIINKKNVEYIHFDKGSMRRNNSKRKGMVIPIQGQSLDKSPSQKYYTTLSSSPQLNYKSPKIQHLSSASTIQSTDEQRIAISQLKNNLNTKEALIRELNIRLSSHETTIKELLAQVRSLKEIISKSKEDSSNMSQAFNKEIAMLKEYNESYKHNEARYAEIFKKIKEAGVDVHRIAESVYRRKEEDEGINSEMLVSLYFPDKIIRNDTSMTDGNYYTLKKDLIPKLNFDKVHQYQTEESDHDKDYVNYAVNGLCMNNNNNINDTIPDSKGYYFKNSHQYNHSTSNIKMKPKVLFLDFPHNKALIPNYPYQKHKYVSKKNPSNK